MTTNLQKHREDLEEILISLLNLREDPAKLTTKDFFYLMDVYILDLLKRVGLKEEIITEDDSGSMSSWKKGKNACIKTMKSNLEAERLRYKRNENNKS